MPPCALSNLKRSHIAVGRHDLMPPVEPASTPAAFIDASAGNTVPNGGVRSHRPTEEFFGLQTPSVSFLKR